jgi:single-stranded-DNA-specific exonuclease
VAVVNPKLGDTFHYLCSAGLAFKLAHALMKEHRPPDYDLRRTLDLVALGTVADVVPLVGENRLFVSKGLEALTHTQRPGLLALKKMATLENALKTSDIGFRLAPRLNASGRLDTAQASLDLLMATDMEDAEMIAGELDDQNRQRQQLQLKVENEATAILTQQFDAARDGVVLIGSDQWHPGVVGIVAGKLCRRYQRPSFVVAFDPTSGVGKGSGRGLEGVSLVKALHQATDLLIKGGGHDLAAGLSVHRDQFDALRQRLSQSFIDQVGERGFQTTLWIDAEVSLAELTLDFLDAYERLEPFGSENHAPIFCCRKVRPIYEPRLCREKHWRLVFGSGPHKKSAMWFDSGHDPIPPGDLDIVFTIHRNRYRGQETLDLTLLDVRSSL